MGLWTRYGIHRELVVPPAVPLVTVEELKAHLRIDHNEEDELLAEFIESATSQAETFVGRAFIFQTWETFLPAFPCGGRIFLFPYPLSTVESITYWDSEEEATLDPAEYRTVLGEVAGLVERTGTSWPLADQRADAVTVRYVAGYGATSDEVPSRYKTAVKMLAGVLYRNRDACNDDGCAIGGSVKCLLGRQIVDFN